MINDVHEIGIENFKSFDRMARIRLAPITLIYGQNSVGKSSLVQGLLLLRQSLSNSDVANPFQLSPSGEGIELGQPETFFHKGRTQTDQILL
jgi:AAA15 family ATPase/GTPase